MVHFDPIVPPTGGATSVKKTGKNVTIQIEKSARGDSKIRGRPAVPARTSNPARPSSRQKQNERTYGVQQKAICNQKRACKPTGSVENTDCKPSTDVKKRSTRGLNSKLSVAPRTPSVTHGKPTVSKRAAAESENEPCPHKQITPRGYEIINYNGQMRGIVYSDPNRKKMLSPNSSSAKDSKCKDTGSQTVGKVTPDANQEVEMAIKPVDDEGKVVEPAAIRQPKVVTDEECIQAVIRKASSSERHNILLKVTVLEKHLRQDVQLLRDVDECGKVISLKTQQLIILRSQFCRMAHLLVISGQQRVECWVTIRTAMTKWCLKVESLQSALQSFMAKRNQLLLETVIAPSDEQFIQLGLEKQLLEKTVNDEVTKGNDVKRDFLDCLQTSPNFNSRLHRHPKCCCCICEVSSKTKPQSAKTPTTSKKKATRSATKTHGKSPPKPTEKMQEKTKLEVKMTGTNDSDTLALIHLTQCDSGDASAATLNGGSPQANDGGATLKIPRKSKLAKIEKPPPSLHDAFTICGHYDDYFVHGTKATKGKKSDIDLSKKKKRWQMSPEPESKDNAKGRRSHATKRAK